MIPHPIRKIQALLQSFFLNEKSVGVLLIFCAITSILISNSSWGQVYSEFWNIEIYSHSVAKWINDGLMSIFFLMIGLELKREVYVGELSSWKKASLPVMAAIGGVLVPALTFYTFNKNTAYIDGTGIPMATDIAFAIGILSLLGKRVPFSLKIFLTALAVIDDLMAIIVIAIFYTTQIQFLYLALAIICFLALCLGKIKKVNNHFLYIIGGILMWFLMLKSGIHPTISGVLLAFAIPFGDGSKKFISYRWQKKLHYPVTFLILPLFALSNTCIIFNNNWVNDLSLPLSKGIMVGLIIGKPIGISIFTLLSLHLGIGKLSPDLKWKHILGIGFLGGIGFTMSIFITLLAFNNSHWIDVGKIAVIVSSIISGLVGATFLYLTLPVKQKK